MKKFCVAITCIPCASETLYTCYYFYFGNNGKLYSKWDHNYTAARKAMYHVMKLGGKTAMECNRYNGAIFTKEVRF